MIPQMDIRANYPSIKAQVMNKLEALIDRSEFIGGEEVALFEKEFAEFNGTSHCIACSNGTDAITIALRALNVGVGDVVLVPVNTFIATSEAVTASGAKVEFVDVDPDYYTIDPVQVERFILENPSSPVKAIIAVHLYGQMADMEGLRTLADNHHFFIVEDSAQAQGALFNGKGPGIIGDIATYSFYPGKNLGAFGDAGGITTNNAELALRCKMLTNHGRGPGDKYVHRMEGYNNRMDAIQAAILRIKLRHLSVWNEMRNSIAKRYTEGLAGAAVRVPKVSSGNYHVWYVYTIRVENREDFIEKTKFVFKSGIYYPITLHRLKAYVNHSSKVFKVAEKLAPTIVSIPMYPELSVSDQNLVIDTIHQVCTG